MEPLTLKIGVTATKLLLRLGKEGIKNALTETLVEASATKTQLEFESIEIRDSLIKWSRSDDFVEVLRNLKDGERPNLSAIVPQFIKDTGFYTGDADVEDAHRILESFVFEVVDQLYKTADGLSVLASRQEVLHNETRDHFTHEASQIIERLSVSESDQHEHIKSEFKYHTSKALRNVRVEITGIKGPLPRAEVSIIENQFELGFPVLLSGEPGTGKSGVAMFVAEACITAGKLVLYLDARGLQHIHDEAGLRHALSIAAPVSQVLDSLSREGGVLLVIDQFDNAVNQDIANVLVDLAIECSALNIDVLVVSRNREGHESKLLTKLTDRNFVSIACRELTTERSQELLQLLGIKDAPSELVQMCRNLLNLDIVAKIKNRQPAFDFSKVFEEVTLWDGYTDVMASREAERSNLQTSEEMIAEAMTLARHSLQAGKQTFIIEQPTAAHRRLNSWGVILSVEGNVYQFSHEKLQDYMYARYAADRGYMPGQVLSEVSSLKSKSIFDWIEQIYTTRRSAFLAQFVEETLNG